MPDSFYHQQGKEKLSGRERGEAQCSVQKGSRLLGLRVLRAESGSITRVQGDSKDRFRMQGHHQLPAPAVLWEGDWVEKVHRHITSRDKKLTGDGQRALQWTRASYISNLSFPPSLHHADISFLEAGVEQL